MNAPLYSSQQVRELDRRAIQDNGISSADLMERAGCEVWWALRARWPRARRIAVLCGVGNNGGDGYVVAEQARKSGLEVVVVTMGTPTVRDSDAARFAAAWGGHTADFSTIDLSVFDVLVDALFGIGLARELIGNWRAAVAAINDSGVPVLAVDVPSGLNADTGAVLGVAVEAAATVTFIGRKFGLFTGEGPAYCGEVIFADLGVPADVYQHSPLHGELLHGESFVALCRPRTRTTHKGNFGHVLIVGGDLGYAGAVRMASEAAMRAGAGLVSLATRPEHAAQLVAGRPEIMVHAVQKASELKPLLAAADIIGIGPGLGRDAWGRSMLSRVLESVLPKVIDADGLNLLAEEPSSNGQWVLTPHPGEAARLLGLSIERVNNDRYAAARAIQSRYGGVCVLKGAGTIVAGPSSVVAVSVTGNPGMATGGMGDVLTGIIAGLMAQRNEPELMARFGAWLHGAAGDQAAREGGERGLIATDLMPFVRRLVNDPHVAV